MGRAWAGDEKDAIEVELIACTLCNQQMSGMNGVEGSAEKPDLTQSVSIKFARLNRAYKSAAISNAFYMLTHM